MDLSVCPSFMFILLKFYQKAVIILCGYLILVGEGGGVVWGNLGVILVRVCEPVFQNLPHSYTWPSKKTDPFIHLIIQNVDLFIYCPLIFCTHFLLVITQIS